MKDERKFVGKAKKLVDEWHEWPYHQLTNREAFCLEVKDTVADVGV
ncbi:hypothetical protein [Gracilibacillus lacisalsi]|nr:hypothetical protein [Gracilibacillus lacisalsi]